MGRRRNATNLFQFVYDPVRGDYVGLDGVPVDNDLILEEMENRISDGQRIISNAFQSAINGQLSTVDAQVIAITELRNTNIQLYALGRGGWESMTPSDYVQASQILKEEINYFNNFMKDVIEGKLSPAQIQARLTLYSKHAWQQYWQGKMEAMKQSGFTQERRIAKDDNGTCNDCKNYEAEGWQPIGTLPRPGQDSVCKARCRCLVEYR